MAQVTPIDGAPEFRPAPAKSNRKVLLMIGIIATALLLFLLWPFAKGSFTIGRGDSLINHVEYDEAIDLAQQHGLKIIATPLGGTAYTVTPDQARELKAHTDVIRVDPQVFAGDAFDRDAGTFVPASPRLN